MKKTWLDVARLIDNERCRYICYAAKQLDVETEEFQSLFEMSNRHRFRNFYYKLRDMCPSDCTDESVKQMRVLACLFMHGMEKNK